MSQRADHARPCVECDHFASHEDGCTECDCMLTDSEAASGRDESIDEAITQARWEQAVADGDDWAMQDRATTESEASA